MWRGKKKGRHLPLLIHPDPQKALVISFGAGVTTGAVARHDLEQIDAVEISPEVIDANRYFIEEGSTRTASWPNGYPYTLWLPWITRR